MIFGRRKSEANESMTRAEEMGSIDLPPAIRTRTVR